MGKRSKIYKSGLPRNQIKKQKDIKNTIPIIKPPQIIKVPITNDNTKKESKGAILVNYNLDALKKANETLGLTEEQMMSLYKHPMRNRRLVQNLTLTKREKKKELRKLRKEMKEKMEEKTRLDITMNPFIHKKDDIIINNLSKREDNKKNKINKTSIGFNFDEMNGLIDNMMDEEEIRAKNDNKNNKSSMRNKKQKDLIYNEADKINNLLNDKEFLNNPNQLLKMQIQDNQKRNEINQKIREDFNKNYNLLNLK